MSESNLEDTKEQQEHAEDDASKLSPQEEEEALKKKYGGILPKKPPLINKDSERAFFDSADWALGKQGAPSDEKPKVSPEALRPKLQPTPQQQVRSRRPSYAEDGGSNHLVNSEDQSSPE